MQYLCKKLKSIVNISLSKFMISMENTAIKIQALGQCNKVICALLVQISLFMLLVEHSFRGLTVMECGELFKQNL